MEVGGVALVVKAIEPSNLWLVVFLPSIDTFSSKVTRTGPLPCPVETVTV